MVDSPIKNMSYWKAKRDASPGKFVGAIQSSSPGTEFKPINPNESMEEKIDRKTEEKVEEKVELAVNQKSGDGITV